MRLSDFDYDLPAELIAQRPARPRDAARMLTLDVPTGALNDRLFGDLPDTLRPSDTLVLNDTRVIRARMRGLLERANGTTRPVEIFFAEPAAGAAEPAAGAAEPAAGAAEPAAGAAEPAAGAAEPAAGAAEPAAGAAEPTAGAAEPAAGAWRVLSRPGRRIREGDRVLFPGGARGVFLDGASDGGLRLMTVESSGDLTSWLDQYGETPIPPYISRTSPSSSGQTNDDADYQTVFASVPGAVAAPTAGLHFTEETLQAIRARGIRIAHITLHVGIGTFLPVRTNDPRDHALRPERFELSAAAADTLETARREGGRIVAVGTTVTRTLEYVIARHNAFKPDSGETDLFILPGHRFRAVDTLLTNFHLPRSTLLMLVAAFAGRDTILRAYQHAVDRRYRFYSYGDCMLISR
ncbi:MAG TPA: tRNA preQ1(34) S-adenosylmethionine ribosyltransferase-isomerase QueA [Terriglobia bacterium]|nr:tRNA preQ1(34) S-adenosylmethionine ribosyltransferase-isomerase QueA [Terriglobia bacterium]